MKLFLIALQKLKKKKIAPNIKRRKNLFFVAFSSFAWVSWKKFQLALNAISDEMTKSAI